MRISKSAFLGATRPAVAAGLALVLAACASGDDPGLRGSRSSVAIGARLQPIAGGVGQGLITFRPYDGGLVVVANVGGFTSGTYRIVIHTTPVCTSPNGFSAGPPFVPAGAAGPVVLTLFIWEQGTADLSTRVPGLALTGPAGIEGRSVVLHASQFGPLDTTPGVVNDRVGCGAIGPIPTMF